MVALSLRGALTSLGYELVGEARNGREAVDLTASARPDVVLMDVKMPVMDGLTAADLIMRSTPTAIVVITSYPDPPLVSAADLVGVMAYLLKPVDERQLGATLPIAYSRFQESQRRLAEKHAAEHALQERKLVERAKGILMRHAGLTEEEAYEYIRRKSRDHRTRKQDIAQQIINADGTI